MGPPANHRRLLFLRAVPPKCCWRTRRACDPRRLSAQHLVLACDLESDLMPLSTTAPVTNGGRSMINLCADVLVALGAAVTSRLGNQVVSRVGLNDSRGRRIDHRSQSRGRGVRASWTVANSLGIRES